MSRSSYILLTELSRHSSKYPVANQHTENAARPTPPVAKNAVVGAWSGKNYCHQQPDQNGGSDPTDKKSDERGNVADEFHSQLSTRINAPNLPTAATRRTTRNRDGAPPLAAAPKLGRCAISHFHKLMVTLGANPVWTIGIANRMHFIVTLVQLPATNLAMIVTPCAALHLEVSRIVSLAIVKPHWSSARNECISWPPTFPSP